MIPTTIVVPLDGSTLAEHALPVAETLADRLGSDLLLVTTRWDHDPQSPQAYLERVADRITKTPTHTAVIPDHGPADAIGLVAREEPGRTVCMTSHGRGGLRWAFLGSVAEEVIHASEGPVVLVGRRCWESWPPLANAPLVVCTDGSAASEEVVPHACAWAKALGLGLSVARVIHPADLDGVAHREVVLDPLLDRIRADGVPAEPVVLRSSFPAGALPDLAESLPASMLAMSTRGTTGYARVTLGSVTMGVLNAAPCPVLVSRAVARA